MTAEKFLREKLISEVSIFGDGTTEFHTRDLQHLLQCLDHKDEIIRQAVKHRKINFNAEKRFKDLLELCMTINNLSADQRLYYIRQEYKKIWNEMNIVEKV